MNKKYTILIIDDVFENLKLLKNILSNEAYEIKASTDAKFAIQSAKISKPDLILLDIKMPLYDGFEICALLKKDDELKNIPVIFISALDDVESKVKAFEEGGVDYITKPFEKEEVIARVKTQLEISSSKKQIENLLTQQDFFLKKIIHEINTPLSIITLNIDNLVNQQGPNENFEAIKASTKSLSSIYNDLYYLVKKEKVQYANTHIDMANFISKRVMFFDEMANVKNIDIDLSIGKNFNLEFSKYELERIIDNTFSNALKYSNKDTFIEIVIDSDLDNDTSTKEENFYIEIIDQGIGIENPNEIFNPYYQQKDDNKGLGLGLNIVKEICDKYEIKIEVKSQKNNTSFKYIFPNKITRELS